MKVLGIIPSRYQSTRLPGKPLKPIGGTSMIQRVYQQCLKSELNTVVVATDSRKIFDHIKAFKGEVIMTSENHNSGTDRCAEVIDKPNYQDFDFIVNIQGDEPFIDPGQINQLIDLMRATECQIGTLIKHSKNSADILSPNNPKVAIDKYSKALYFSRSIIPYQQNELSAYLHVGMYGYQKAALKTISCLEPSKLELLERLEQLRWLENGFSIHTAITEIDSISIDTPEDLEKAQKIVGINLSKNNFLH